MHCLCMIYVLIFKDIYQTLVLKTYTNICSTITFSFLLCKNIKCQPMELEENLIKYITLGSLQVSVMRSMSYLSDENQNYFLHCSCHVHRNAISKSSGSSLRAQRRWATTTKTKQRACSLLTICGLLCQVDIHN